MTKRNPSFIPPYYAGGNGYRPVFLVVVNKVNISVNVQVITLTRTQITQIAEVPIRQVEVAVTVLGNLQVIGYVRQRHRRLNLKVRIVTDQLPPFRKLNRLLPNYRHSFKFQCRCARHLNLVTLVDIPAGDVVEIKLRTIKLTSAVLHHLKQVILNQLSHEKHHVRAVRLQVRRYRVPTDVKIQFTRGGNFAFDAFQSDRENRLTSDAVMSEQ